ncbi:RNA polymerase sigma factor [Streptomyces phaeochromogenes]|uniref:RNA polymerase sigma factor n=2 Tax=Streptomyces phaeochromogenes TaxID=1923 RepID=UPI0037AF365B
MAKGDRAAFGELYRRTSPWMAVRLRRRCVDEQIVAEVMQETYLAVWRAAGAFAGAAVGGTATGWLWTIAARRLVDAFRRRAHHAQPPPAAAPPDVAPAAEELALAETVGGDVGDALRCLAPELRQVLQALTVFRSTTRPSAWIAWNSSSASVSLTPTGVNVPDHATRDTSGQAGTACTRRVER